MSDISFKKFNYAAYRQTFKEKLVIKITAEIIGSYYKIIKKLYIIEVFCLKENLTSWYYSP